MLPSCSIDGRVVECLEDHQKTAKKIRCDLADADFWWASLRLLGVILDDSVLGRSTILWSREERFLLDDFAVPARRKKRAVLVCGRLCGHDGGYDPYSRQARNGFW